MHHANVIPGNDNRQGRALAGIELQECHRDIFMAEMIDGKFPVVVRDINVQNMVDRFGDSRLLS